VKHGTNLLTQRVAVAEILVLLLLRDTYARVQGNNGTFDCWHAGISFLIKVSLKVYSD